MSAGEYLESHQARARYFHAYNNGTGKNRPRKEKDNFFFFSKHAGPDNFPLRTTKNDLSCATGIRKSAYLNWNSALFAISHLWQKFGPDTLIIYVSKGQPCVFQCFQLLCRGDWMKHFHFCLLAADFREITKVEQTARWKCFFPHIMASVFVSPLKNVCHIDNSGVDMRCSLLINICHWCNLLL